MRIRKEIQAVLWQANTALRRKAEEIAMTERAQRIVLASRPVGEPTLDNFRLEELPIPQPGPGQMLLRTRWLSLDPYMRGRMSDAPSYAKPVGIGEVMEGGTVGEVVTSNVSGFTKGDIVVGRTGWQTHALSDGSGLQKVDPTRAPISTAVGVLGMPGMTAYMGLLEIGKPPLERPWWSRRLRRPRSRPPSGSSSRSRSRRGRRRDSQSTLPSPTVVTGLKTPVWSCKARLRGLNAPTAQHVYSPKGDVLR
jgi:hypothetical protein